VWRLDFWRADVLVRLGALETAVEDDSPPIILKLTADHFVVIAGIAHGV